MNDQTDWTKHGILCDMDGVIISLYARWIKPFETLISRINPNFNREAIIEKASSLLLGHGGRNKRIMFRGIKKVCEIGELTKLQKYRVYVNLLWMVITRKKFEIVPLDGVEETLLLLKKMGLRLALVTTASNYTTKRLKRKYPEIYNRFEYVLSRNDVQFTKPFPDQLVSAMKKLRVNAENTVMVGDLITDILAGKNAGVKTVAVLSEFPEITKLLLESVEPDFFINSLSELPDYLPLIFNK